LPESDLQVPLGGKSISHGCHRWAVGISAFVSNGRLKMPWFGLHAVNYNGASSFIYDPAILLGSFTTFSDYHHVMIQLPSLHKKQITFDLLRSKCLDQSSKKTGVIR